MTRASFDALEAFVAEAPVPRRAILSFVREFASSLEPQSRVLDAGAGSAPYRGLFVHCDYVTQDWPGSVHATDFDIVGDLQAGLPVEDCAFDAILCTEVLEHVEDVDAVLAELRRISRPGARLACTVPFVGPLHEEPHDYRRFTNHGLKSLLEANGFDVHTVAPLSGWFGTLAQMLREHAAATRAPDRAPGLDQRILGRCTVMLAGVVGRAAERLDRRIDLRNAFPIGWCAVAQARER